MPDLPVLVGWALLGWCGTVPRPRPPFPPTPPDPEPWWRGALIGIAIGLVGGVIGGWTFNQLFSADLGSAAGVLLTFAGAFAGGRVAGDLGAMGMSGR